MPNNKSEGKKHPSQKPLIKSLRAISKEPIKDGVIWTNSKQTT